MAPGKLTLIQFMAPHATVYTQDKLDLEAYKKHEKGRLIWGEVGKWGMDLGEVRRRIGA